MMSLGGWMNKVLIGWGIDPKFADMFDETIIALLMVGLSIGLDYLCQAIFVGGMKHYTRRSPRSMEYVADETQGDTPFDTYSARNPHLLPAAHGLCAWKGDA